MRQTRTIAILLVLAGVAAAAGLAWAVQRRQAACLPTPVLAAELLPNATLAPDAASPNQAAGWGYRTSSGVALQQPSRGQGFDLDGDDRALQLIGIANYVETPAIPVQPGRSYCFSGFALTDQADKGATRVQPLLRWLDAAGAEIGTSAGDWQPVALWQPGASSWSALRAAGRAPDGAAQLRVRLQPAADNRLYLDAMHVRTTSAAPPPAEPPRPLPITIQPWPDGYAAALSFSFDWETTMGGLVHSRSLAAEDPNNAEDPRERGMRMRQGITTTLELFRSYNLRATYYATGYNFLSGNTERRSFMGDPSFSWASPANGWKSDWSGRPWFGSDPYGSIASAPDYYFGDLIAPLLAAGHDIQTHTFSHLYGGYASPAQWQADFAAWQQVAGRQGVAAPRSLAFPWSGSGGMSDANWRALEDAGITSVTRTNRSQSQYQLMRPENPHCAPVPGHARILACPDFYLTARSANQAITLLNSTIAAGGMIDLWAHTEEVTTPAQIAAWAQVVRAAAAQRDAGRLWIAPLAEIADWQAGLAKVNVQRVELNGTDTANRLAFSITNAHDRGLHGLAIDLPFIVGKCIVNGLELNTQHTTRLTLNLAAGQMVEVQAWPA